MKKQADSTLFYLRAWLFVEPEHWMIVHIDPDLAFLKNHKGWKHIEAIIQKKYNTYKKPELAAELEKLNYLDQKYRGGSYLPALRGQRILAIDTLGERDFEEWDHKNLLELKRITDNLNNLPDPSEVSIKAYTAIFLILQHSNDIESRKKFSKILEGHCLFYKRWCKEYAMMYDRLLLDETGFQKYGTHRYNSPTDPSLDIYEPFLHPEKVNEYRKSIHLGLIDVNQSWIIK